MYITLSAQIKVLLSCGLYLHMCVLVEQSILNALLIGSQEQNGTTKNLFLCQQGLDAKS
jgi:hypothetical protein